MTRRGSPRPRGSARRCGPNRPTPCRLRYRPRTCSSPVPPPPPADAPMPKRSRWMRLATQPWPTLYTRSSPCAHPSAGPTCPRIPGAGMRGGHRVADPDPRTAGRAWRCPSAVSRSRCSTPPRARHLSGYRMRMATAVPASPSSWRCRSTGKIALPSGESKWIAARSPAPRPPRRAHSDMILVGRGTYSPIRPASMCAFPG